MQLSIDENEDMFVFVYFFFGFSPPPAKQIYSCHLIKKPPLIIFFSRLVYLQMYFSCLCLLKVSFFNDDNSIIINGRTFQILFFILILYFIVILHEKVFHFVFEQFLNKPPDRILHTKCSTRPPDAVGR